MLSPPEPMRRASCRACIVLFVSDRPDAPAPAQHDAALARRTIPRWRRSGRRTATNPPRRQATANPSPGGACTQRLTPPRRSSRDLPCRSASSLAAIKTPASSPRGRRLPSTPSSCCTLKSRSNGVNIYICSFLHSRDATADIMVVRRLFMPRAEGAAGKTQQRPTLRQRFVGCVRSTASCARARPSSHQTMSASRTASACS